MIARQIEDFPKPTTPPGRRQDQLGYLAADAEDFVRGEPPAGGLQDSRTIGQSRLSDRDVGLGVDLAVVAEHDPAGDGGDFDASLLGVVTLHVVAVANLH